MIFLKGRKSVMQEWTESLSFMQQSVLIASVRGPDGIRKEHPVKVLCRWLRRGFLLSAFEAGVFESPYEPGGGSFTGPCYIPPEAGGVDSFVDEYLRSIDELPHHFQLHFMHAAEILGYKHPVPEIRTWWNTTYLRIVSDAHLFPESEAQMDERLGDNEKAWRAREEVTAR